MSDFHSNGTADNNCGDTSTIISISVCVSILLMLNIYFYICFCYLCSRKLLVKQKKSEFGVHFWHQALM